MASKFNNDGDGASPGKIFIGGLPKDTTNTIFMKHFGKYGEITDFVIMKDRLSGQPRGFGFITYADPSVVDLVIQDTHTINAKQVDIKRTIPKGAPHSKDFKTKKIFVGGIPSTMNLQVFSLSLVLFVNTRSYVITTPIALVGLDLLFLILNKWLMTYSLRAICFTWRVPRWRSRKLNQRNPQTNL